jgi:hypothetical protein
MGQKPFWSLVSLSQVFWKYLFFPHFIFVLLCNFFVFFLLCSKFLVFKIPCVQNSLCSKFLVFKIPCVQNSLCSKFLVFKSAPKQQTTMSSNPTFEECAVAHKDYEQMTRRLFTDTSMVYEQWKTCKQDENLDGTLKPRCDSLFDELTKNRKCWSTVYAHFRKVLGNEQSEKKFYTNKLKELECRQAHSDAKIFLNTRYLVNLTNGKIGTHSLEIGEEWAKNHFGV